jgi:outer membrane autotransporter protein
MKKLNLYLASLGLYLLTFGFAGGQNTEEQRAYVGSTYIGSESLRQSSAFLDGVLAGSGGISAGASYANYDVNEDSDRRFEGDYQTMGGSLGYMHAFEGFNLGVSATFIDSEFEAESTTINPGVVETEGDGWIVSVGASKSWERLSLSVLGAIGELSFDSTRSNTFGPKDSDYDLSLYQLELAALYALISNDDFDLSPFAKLGYISLENDGFEESVADDVLTAEDFEDEVPYAEVGIHAALKSLGEFVPYASASVWQDLGDDSVEIEYSRIALNTEIPDAAGTVIKGELGFGFTAGESLYFGGSLGYFAGDEIDGFNAGIFGAWSF